MVPPRPHRLPRRVQEARCYGPVPAAGRQPPCHPASVGKGCGGRHRGGGFFFF